MTVTNDTTRGMDAAAVIARNRRYRARFVPRPAVCGMDAAAVIIDAVCVSLSLDDDYETPTFDDAITYANALDCASADDETARIAYVCAIHDARRVFVARMRADDIHAHCRAETDDDRATLMFGYALRTAAHTRAAHVFGNRSCGIASVFRPLSACA